MFLSKIQFAFRLQKMKEKCIFFIKAFNCEKFGKVFSSYVRFKINVVVLKWSFLFLEGSHDFQFFIR